MVQYQNASNSIAVRLAIAYAGLLVTDFVLLSICVLDIYLNGVTMIILFASEVSIFIDYITYFNNYSMLFYSLMLLRVRLGSLSTSKTFVLGKHGKTNHSTFSTSISLLIS